MHLGLTWSSYLGWAWKSWVSHVAHPAVQTSLNVDQSSELTLDLGGLCRGIWAEVTLICCEGLAGTLAIQSTSSHGTMRLLVSRLGWGPGRSRIREPTCQDSELSTIDSHVFDGITELVIAIPPATQNFKFLKLTYWKFLCLSIAK